MKTLTTLALSLILVAACGTAQQSNLDATANTNPGLCQYKHKKDTLGGKKGETNTFDFQRKTHTCDVKGDWKAACKDGNGDTDEVECKAVSTDDVQRAALKDMKLLDKDSDGFVTLKELNVLAANLQVPPQTADGYFTDADTDNDGRLSQTEFVLGYKNNVFPWAKSRVGS